MGANALIGFGNAADYGEYDVVAITMVSVGCVLAGTALLASYREWAVSRALSRIILEAALAVAVVTSIAFRGNLYGKGDSLYLSIGLMIVAAASSLFLVTAGHHRQTLIVCAALVTAATVASVISSPEPRIDVWHMYQAVARGLLHLHNVYTQRWSPHLPGQATTYAYFPGSAVVLTPFYLLFGDVRYGVVAALTLSSLLIGTLSRRSEAAVFGAVLLLYPRVTYSVEQSWSEPLVLLALLLTVVAVRRGRTGWAVTTFAAVLTFQQYDLILIPLAAAWKDFGPRRTVIAVAAAAAFIIPWAIANPSSFVRGTFTYDVHYEFSFQSLSLFGDLSSLDPLVGYVVLGTVLVVVLIASMRFISKTGGFLAGCGLVMASFDLFDKIARFNEWELVSGVLLAAGAQGLGTPGKVGLWEGTLSNEK